MKPCASNLCNVKRIHTLPSAHLFISAVAMRGNIKIINKRARRYWRKLIKVARHKSAQEFFQVFHVISKDLFPSEMMLKQTHDGWNLFSKVARCQKGENFLAVYQSMNKKTLARVLQQRNKNGASAFGLAARYQSSDSFGLFLEYIELKGLEYSLFNQGKEHAEILLNNLLVYQSARNMKKFIKMIGETGLLRMMRQHDHNRDNGFSLFFSGSRSKEQIINVLNIINRPSDHKYYQRTVKSALLKTNKKGWHALHHIAQCQSAKLFEGIIQRFDVKAARRILGRRTKDGDNVLNLVINSEEPIKKLEAIYKKFNTYDVNKVLLKKNRKGWSPFMQILRQENPYLVKYALQKINNNSSLIKLIHDKNLTGYEQEWLSRMIVKNTARNIFSSSEPSPVSKKITNMVAEYKSVFIKETLDILKAKHNGLHEIKRIKFVLLKDKAKLVKLTHSDSFTAYELEWLAKMTFKSNKRNILKPMDKKVVEELGCIVKYYKSIFPKGVFNLLVANHDDLCTREKIKLIDKKTVESVKNAVQYYKSVFSEEVFNLLAAKNDALDCMDKITRILYYNKQKLNKKDQRIDATVKLIRTRQAKKTYNHFRPVLFKRHKKKRKNPFASAIREIDLVLQSFESCEVKKNGTVESTVERSLTPKVFEFVA